MTSLRARLFLATLPIAAVSALAGAQSGRQMMTDRSSADATPFTIGRGAMQVEVDLFSRSVSSRGYLDEYVWNVGVTTAKFGVSRRMDVEVSYQPYSEVALIVPETCVLTRTQGTGNVTFGAKYTVWNRSDRQSAFALVPWVAVPTSDIAGGRVEGGVALPLAIDVGNGFTAVLTTSIATSGATSSDSSAVRVSQSASVGRQIFNRVSGYASVSGRSAAQPGLGLDASAAGGITIAVTSNLQLNGGARIGLSDASERSAAYVGFAVRR